MSGAKRRWIGHKGREEIREDGSHFMSEKSTMLNITCRETTVFVISDADGDGVCREGMKMFSSVYCLCSECFANLTFSL